MKSPGYRYILIPLACGVTLGTALVVVLLTGIFEPLYWEPTSWAFVSVILAPTEWLCRMMDFPREAGYWPLIILWLQWSFTGLLVGLVLYTWRKFFPVR